jgi:hypothetical protein
MTPLAMPLPSPRQELVPGPRGTQRANAFDGPPDRHQRSDRRARWAVLASLTLVSFLLLLDDTAVALALPAIRLELGLGLSGLEWVVNGYTLPLAAFMLLGGQLADRHGRRRCS